MSKVVVIGAGVVGMATAIELLRDNHSVTIVEPDAPGGEQAASYGNGTLLNPSSVIPMSAPGIWKKVPGYLMDPLGPLTILWSYLPCRLPWPRLVSAAPAALAGPLPQSRFNRGENRRYRPRPATAARRRPRSAPQTGRES